MNPFALLYRRVTDWYANRELRKQAILRYRKGQCPVCGDVPRKRCPVCRGKNYGGLFSETEKREVKWAYFKLTGCDLGEE